MFATPASAQSLTGTLRGVVLDQQGQVVPDAKITLTNEGTGADLTTTSSGAGTYNFPALPSGSYKIKAEAKGFAAYLRTGIQVQSSQVTEVTVNLEVASATTTVVVESGANVVQTESSQLSGTFQSKSIAEIPIQTGAFGTVLNLSIFLPNTTTQLGGTSGTGGSVGGLRGRQNSFSIDGTDNNDPTVTTSTQQVIPDAVQELVVNQNVYSAEYGRGAGGQFNIITKTGTNQVHFDAWLYNINRAYDAADNQEKAAIASGAATDKRRFDFNRVGGDIGGPIWKDKLFLYGAYELNNTGFQATAPSALAPTSAGLTTLNSLAVDQQVKDLLAQFPVASTGTTTVPVTSGYSAANPAGTVTQVPVGPVQSVAPSYTNQQDYIINGDYNVGQQSLHGRYLKSRTRTPSFGSSFPQAQFGSSSAVDSRRVILNDVWTATPHIVNDFKASFVRFTQAFPLGGVASNFPTLTVDDLQGITIGPNGNLPQHRAFDEYTLGDSVSWTHGRHTIKGGGQYFWFISPSDFLQNERGQYGYSTLSAMPAGSTINGVSIAGRPVNSLTELVNDLVPSKANFTLQGLGSGFFSGNSKNFSLFAQDDIKVSSRLTLNLGLRYDYFGNPAGVVNNALNSVASLPGTPLVFNVPKDDRNNFGPRVGFAWDPTGSGKWAVRGGAGVAFDLIPWNFYTNANPIQLQAVLTTTAACVGTFGAPPAWCSSRSSFLSSGALRVNFVPPNTTGAARAQTANIMADAAAPKVFSWSLGVQREIFKNTSLEVRYLGTRALELPVQLQLNSITPFELGAQPLPTFFSAADIPATVPANSPTLAQFQALQGRRFAAQGFTGGAITVEAPVGDSTYHGGAVEFLHRFSHGLLFRANYTYAKTMDNSTNDLNTSAVNPRRPQDSFNLRNEWARSALDVTHKVALTWLYDLPKANLNNRILRGFANGWQYSGSYLFQSGQPASIQSGVDSNGNLDAAGDRAFLNPAGTAGVGSTVSTVCRNPNTNATFIGDCDPTHADDKTVGGDPTPGGAFTVGYAANTPNARFIQAGVGTKPNLGRNTFNSPYFNIWNMSILKNNHVTERFGLQIRVDAFDVFNHRQFTFGQLSVLGTNTNALSQGYANINSGSAFLNQSLFNGGSRTVQLGLKLTY
jgi:outer membrane receptor protein involved in Fe transport